MTPSQLNVPVLIVSLVVSLIVMVRVSASIVGVGPTSDIEPFIVRGLSSSSWELDYLHELFPPPYFTFLSEHRGPADVFICQGSPETKLLAAAHRSIPILIHLSDEHLIPTVCRQLYARSALVLRCYGSMNERFPDHVRQIPVGFMTNYLNNSVSSSSSSGRLDSVQTALANLFGRNHSDSRRETRFNSISSREFRWAFIGGMHGKGKRDRQQMLETFNSWTPHFVGSDLTPEEMRMRYESSVFVLSGRGWMHLDCLRIYEAILAGAIPILIGPSHELTKVFDYGGRMIPTIYSEDPRAALEKARAMSESQVKDMQGSLVLWWAVMCHQIRLWVAEALRRSNATRGVFVDEWMRAVKLPATEQQTLFRLKSDLESRGQQQTQGIAWALKLLENM